MASMTNEELDAVAEAPADECEMEQVLRDLFDLIGGSFPDRETCEVPTDDFQDQLTAFVGCQVRTFEEAGLMTGNRGIVLTVRGGRQFQITVVG